MKRIAGAYLSHFCVFCFSAIGFAAPVNMLVGAGHFLQKFDGQTGAFIGNVTTNWNSFSSNADLGFGPDGNIFGLGANGWVYKYNFATQTTSVFAQPSGDLGASGRTFGPDGNMY